MTPRLAADPELATGRLIALVEPTGERSFLTDRGANDALSPPDIPLGVVEAADHIHISGYALISPGPRGAVMSAMKRAVGTPVSVDPGSAEFLREVGSRTFFWIGYPEPRCCSRTPRKRRCLRAAMTRRVSAKDLARDLIG